MSLILPLSVILFVSSLGLAALLRRKIREMARIQALNQRHQQCTSTLFNVLNPPIIQIKGPLAAAVEGTYGDLDIALRRDLKAALYHTQCLEQLIHQMQDLSRFDANQIGLDLTSLPLHSTFRFEPAPIQIKPADHAFLEKVRRIIEANISNRQFGVVFLAEEMGKSARQLQRDLKRIGNLKASMLIQTMRLQRAAQLLKQRPGEVARVAEMVGYGDVKYFSRIFKQSFGVRPSKWKETPGPTLQDDNKIHYSRFGSIFQGKLEPDF